jgi:hypothetical protein
LNQNRTIIGDAPTNLVLTVSDTNGDTLTFQTNTLPTHGLLQNFSPTNGVVTYLPAHGFRGTDRFTFSANDSLAVSGSASMNLNVVAPPDADGNGLPDAWETQFGVHDPNADDDGDGRSNLEEFRANTNPTNAASVIRITGIVRTADGHTVMTWASIGGVRYRVQYGDGASSGFDGNFTGLVRPVTVEMDPNPNGAASTQSFIDDYSLTGGAPATGRRFYRVKVVE